MQHKYTSMKYKLFYKFTLLVIIAGSMLHACKKDSTVLQVDEKYKDLDSKVAGIAQWYDDEMLGVQNTLFNNQNKADWKQVTIQNQNSGAILYALALYQKDSLFRELNISRVGEENFGLVKEYVVHSKKKETELRFYTLNGRLIESGLLTVDNKYIVLKVAKGNTIRLMGSEDSGGGTRPPDFNFNGGNGPGNPLGGVTITPPPSTPPNVPPVFIPAPPMTFPAFPGGGGGTGGNNSGGGSGSSFYPPYYDILKDSLTKYYPCMVQKVLNELNGNQTYVKLIQPFANINLPDGSQFKIQGVPKLIFGFSDQEYGGSGTTYQLGQTGRIPPTYAGYSSKIEFNSRAIENASTLFMQATAVHEVAHAYANFYITAGKYNKPIDTMRYSTWAMDIVNFESMARSESSAGNYVDHSLFLEYYVDNFIKVLKEINGSAYTDKEYQMAAIYGLDNPGPRTYNYLGESLDLYAIYKSKLEKSYKAILTRFGITESERDDFYRKNLINVTSDKKIGTNCPN